MRLGGGKERTGGIHGGRQLISGPKVESEFQEVRGAPRVAESGLGEFLNLEARHPAVHVVRRAQGEHGAWVECNAWLKGTSGPFLPSCDQ